MSTQRKPRTPIREYGPLSEYTPIMPEWVLEGVDIYSSGDPWDALDAAPAGWYPKVNLTVQHVTQDGPDSPQVVQAHRFIWTPAEAREWAERVLRIAEAMERPYVEEPES